MSSLWQEVSFLIRASGLTTSRGLLLAMAMIGGFGIAVPARRGFDFLDPRFQLAYAAIGLLFAGPAAASILAGKDRPHHPTAVVVASGVYGWAVTLVLLAAGLITINVTGGFGGVLLPPAAVLASTVVLGLCASLFVAAATAWLTLRLSPGSAKLVLRAVFLITLLAFVFGPPVLSEKLALLLTTETLPKAAVALCVAFALATAAISYSLRPPAEAPPSRP